MTQSYPAQSSKLQRTIDRYLEMYGAPTDAGTILLTVTLIFGDQARPVDFTVHYAGEFGVYPKEGEGLRQLGAITSLELRLDDGKTSTSVNAGLLSQGMWHAIDEMILTDVIAQRDTKSP